MKEILKIKKNQGIIENYLSKVEKNGTQDTGGKTGFCQKRNMIS